MDNVTHSLIGVLLARTFGDRLPGVRGVTVVALAASNLPDLDLVMRIGATDPGLSYLVHHRGYTHTLVTTPVTAALATALALAVDPACRARPGGLFGLGLLAAALHIGADGWNNYGIHPFWPFQSAWLYGDTIFIVEPLLWAAMLPVLVSPPLSGTGGGPGWGRWLAAALAAFATLLSAAVLGVLTAAGFLALLGLTWAGYRRVGVDACWAVAGLCFASFAAGSQVAERRVAAALDGLAAGALVEVSRTPRPAVPWCWSVLATELDGDTWRVRRATVSLLPGLSSPEDCRFRAPEAPSFAWDLPDRGDDPSIGWEGVWAASRRALPAGCRTEAFFRFARVPAWQPAEDAERGFLLGDLRYDFEPGLGFAEIEVRPGDTTGCEAVAPWRSAAAARLQAAGPGGR